MNNPWRNTYTPASCLIGVALYLTACRQSSSTANTTTEPTHQYSETAVSLRGTSTPSPSATPATVVDTTLLIQTWNQTTETSDIWVFDPLSLSLHPLYRDEDLYFGWVVWSRDGKMFAYTQTSGYCPTISNSMWLHHMEQSVNTKVTEDIVIEYDCSEQPRPFYYVGAQAWSSDNQVIAVDVLTKAEIDSFDGPRQVLRRKPHLLRVQSRELAPVYPKEALKTLGLDTQYVQDYLTWQSFASVGDRALMATSPEASLERSDTDVEDRVILATSLSNLDVVVQVEPPSDVRPVFSRSRDTTCWSPNGDLLYLFDYTGNEMRFWQAHIETDEWKMIATHTLADRKTPINDSGLVCSPNGHWVAWWSETRIAENWFEYAIAFINTENREEGQQMVSLDGLRGYPVGWVEDIAGNSFLTLWDAAPSGGLFLIDSKGEAESQLLIEHDDLARQLPSRDYRVFPGPWQP